MNAESGAGSEADWKLFLRKHWRVAAIFVAACVLAVIGAVLVFWWFVGTAQSTGLVPSTLNLWSMGHLVTFVVLLIVWEIILIGIPVVIGAIAGWRWWTRLPVKERKQYHFFDKRSRTAGQGGMSLFIFLAFVLKVFLDGRWNEPMAGWTVNYVVVSLIWILVWTAVIIGIPLAIAAVLWIRHEMKKP